MPGFDGTGPRGMGPMTGGMRGRCVPQDAGRPVGFGAGFARGGRGHRRMYCATGLPGWMRFGAAAAVPAPTPADELSALRVQADWVQRQLEAVQARIAETDKAE